MIHQLSGSVLVLVDLQERLMPMIDQREAVVDNAGKLARIAQILEIPVIGTEQNPTGLGNNVAEIRSLCSNTLSKQHFDACADGLIDALPVDRKRVIVAGCEAHVCVLQTVCGLLERGLDVTVVRDAVGSRTAANRDAAIDRMIRSGAESASVEMLAFEWLRSSDHPKFRSVLKLVK